ncbi:MAG: hypothetical protein IPJ45_05890 [Ignavibacteria bacterium]|nr:hypothetical protein [Ignavibacteria bacterium]
MKYDPVKKVFGDIVSNNAFLRKVFYFLLDLMFLRSWHVRKKIKQYFPKNTVMKIFDAGMGFGQYLFHGKRFPDSDILAIDVKRSR